MRVNSWRGSRRTVVIVAVVASMLLGACGESSTPAAAVGSVRGTALQGPNCPVERPGDPACAPRPVVGTVEFRQTNRVVATAVIDSTGAFRAELPAGSYTVTVNVGTGPFPTCPPTELSVTATAIATVTVRCDTGIR